MGSRSLLVAAAALVLAVASPARAKLVAEWCQAGKLRAVGGYESCLLAAEAAALLRGGVADGSRCVARLARRFERLELFSVGYCPSQDDAATLQSAADAHAGDVVSALAGGTSDGPTQRCRAAKLRAVGAHLACRFAFHAADVWRGRAADPSRCDANLSARLSRAENRADGACPTTGDDGALQQLDATHVGEVLDALGGPPPLCGNGIRSANESCDSSDLGGLDCVQAGHPGGGTLACDELCRLDTSACVP